MPEAVGNGAYARKGLLREWQYAQTLVFEHMAAPVLEIMDGFLYSLYRTDRYFVLFRGPSDSWHFFLNLSVFTVALYIYVVHIYAYIYMRMSITMARSRRLAQTMVWWIRFPLKTLMSVHIYFFNVVLCKQRSCVGLIRDPRSSTDCVYDWKIQIENRMWGQDVLLRLGRSSRCM
jgi:hypothetical protein